MSNVRKIFKGASFLGIGELIARSIGAIVTFYLARTLGPQWFGKLNFAFAITSYFLVLSIFGLDLAGIRSLSQRKRKPSQVVSNIAPLLWGMSIISAIIMLIVALFIRSESADNKLIALFCLNIVVNGLTMEWFFQGLEKMRKIAIARILQRVVYAILIFIFVSSAENIYYIPIFLSIAMFVGQSFLWINFLHKNKFVIHFDKNFVSSIIKYAFPIGLAGITISIYRNTDSIMLGLMRTSKDVGFYNAGAKLVLFIALMRHLAMQATFPRLNNLYSSSIKEFRQLAMQLEIIMSGIAVPIMFIIGIFSNSIINILYGNSYIESVKAMPYLLASVAILYSSFVFPNLLNVVGKSWDYFKITLSAAIVNVVFNYIFIPKMGIAGAALGTVVAEITILIISFWLTKHITRFRFFPLFAPTIFGTISMFLLVHIINNIWLKAGVGILSYGIVWFFIYKLCNKYIIEEK